MAHSYPHFRPVDPVTGERLAPSEFESYRRTHELLAPCCLCAYVDRKRYTEAQIGVAETVTEDLTRNQSVLNGEVVAVCGERRCGYFRGYFQSILQRLLNAFGQSVLRGSTHCGG